MQRFETHISDLDRSIDARRALIQSQFENFPISDEEEPDHHFETSSQFSDHTECHTCPDCRMGTPIHLKTRQMSDFDVLVKSCSKTSLTDSAISSMSSCLTKDSISSPPKITDLWNIYSLSSNKNSRSHKSVSLLRVCPHLVWNYRLAGVLLLCPLSVLTLKVRCFGFFTVDCWIVQ